MRRATWCGCARSWSSRAPAVLSLVLLTGAVAEAQFDGATSARVVGLGGASSALRGHGWAAALNPAGLDGLDRPVVSGTLAAAFEPPFLDDVRRPGFLGLAWPLRRLTLSAYAAERLNEQGTGSILGFNSDAAFRIGELGLAGAFRLSSRVSIGAALSRARLEVDAGYQFSGTAGGVPFAFDARQSGRPSRNAVALGLIVHEGDRASAAFTWRRASTFQVPFSRLESFPTLGLSFPETGLNVFDTNRQWRAGVTVRPRGRWLLGADYANSGRVAAVAVPAICIMRAPHVPPAYCVPFGPFGLTLGPTGERLHAGTEVGFDIGRLDIRLRAGYARTWLSDFEEQTQHAGSAGLGVIAGRWSLDVGGVFGFTTRRHQLVASAGASF